MCNMFEIVCRQKQHDGEFHSFDTFAKIERQKSVEISKAEKEEHLSEYLFLCHFVAVTPTPTLRN